MKTVANALHLAAFMSLRISGVRASPIAKVLQMMSDLQARIVADGTEAQKVFEEFAEFCEDRSKELGFELKTAKTEVAELEASAKKDTANIGAMSTKLEELAASIASDEAELKAATEVREKEAADFAAEEKELTEVTDMLQRAIGILEREMQKGGASMLQMKRADSIAEALETLVQASALSSSDGARLTALVQSSQQQESEAGDEDTNLGAPAAAATEGHSSDIIQTLESLLEKAEVQLEAVRKAETSALHNYEMLKQSLEDNMKFAAKDMEAAKQTRAESDEKRATAEGALSATKKDMDEDAQTLDELHQDCMTKAQDFEAATKSRAEELKALTTAKKTLEETAGGAEKGSGESFLQAGRSRIRSRSDLSRFEVVRRIRDLAHEQRSAALAQLATRVATAIRAADKAGADPFAKVKGLIFDMVAKLEEDAEADASQKAYCDKELGETKAKHEDKSTLIEKLSTKIDSMTTRSEQLKEEVAMLQKELSELANSQAAMDKVRREEKADFQKSKSDLDKGLAGVKLALKVLREYYAQGDGAQSSNAGAGAGIIGLLEVVESDLSKSIAEAVETENSSQASYDSETKENEMAKAIKDQDLKLKAKEAASLDKAVAETASDRASTQSELEAVEEYLSSLNKQCVAKPESYEERKARREAEIAGLKEALTALEGEAVLLQRSSRRTLRGRLLA